MIARNSDAREVVVPKMRVRRRDFRKGGLFVAGVFAAVFLFVFLAGRYKLSSETEAANLDNFDPGYIISDYAMGNYTSMSEAEIQAFLSLKVSCNRSEGYYNYLTSAYPGYTWHLKDGHIVCLPEELFGSGETIGAGETAAHIIWQAAQDYKINPQVLIVLLQKEQGLITDDYPNTRQYRSAMGYGCPDTAPCAEEYYGFRNQVRKAAELFRTVLDGGWTNYPLGENYIQYNPSWDCGGSMVNIRSLATSALYRYTPYQPNAAALAAGYGTGDGCSAYGNRNFYHYFEDWFSGITAGGSVASSQRLSKVEYLTDDAFSGSVYEIHSALDTNLVLDISGGASEAKDGTNIQLYEFNDTDAQMWQIKSNYDGTFTILNPATGKVLDVTNASMRDGTNIQLYTSNATCAQKWKITKDTSNVYTIVSACADMVLDVSNGVATNGANIQLYSDNGTNAQKWKMLKKGGLKDYILNVTHYNQNYIEGVYVIRAFADEKLALAGTDNKNTTNVLLGKYDVNDSYMKWRLKKGADGIYILINEANGKALDLSDGSLVNGANVQLFEQNGTCAQSWKIGENMDNSVTFYTGCSKDMVLDVNNGEIVNGRNVQLYETNATVAQKWRLEYYGDEIDAQSTYNIQSILDTNLVLDISGGASEAKDGTNIQLYESNDTDAQMWQIKSNYDGTFTILNPATGKVLDVTNASMRDGTNIQLYTSNATCAQKWKITKDTSNVYTIVSACADMVLDVSNGVATSGANIQLYSDNGTNAQKWKLLKRG